MTQAPAQDVAPPTARPVVGRPGTPPGDSGSPLAPEHLRELELARQRHRKIRRAIGVALFNGWTVGVFAAISLLVGLFSLTSFLIGIALAVVAYNEFAGAKLLRELDLRAPRRLGFNQLGLCAALVTYATWSIYSTFTGPSPFGDALAAGGQTMPLINSIEHLQTVVTLAAYGGLIAGSILFQGGTAWYYFTRARHLRAYVAQTPRWVLELERATARP